MTACGDRQGLRTRLDRYAARFPGERSVVERFRELLHSEPRCFERDCWAGHITGSAWLVNAGGTHVLLTHHRKLDAWLQLGGHSDGERDTLRVAIREAEEESGLAVAPVAAEIFDIDIHEIPPHGGDPAHAHFDVRFALCSTCGDSFRVGEESHALAWVEIERLHELTGERSLLRMAGKWHEGVLAESARAQGVQGVQGVKGAQGIEERRG